MDASQAVHSITSIREVYKTQLAHPVEKIGKTDGLVLNTIH